MATLLRLSLKVETHAKQSDERPVQPAVGVVSEGGALPLVTTRRDIAGLVPNIGRTRRGV